MSGTEKTSQLSEVLYLSSKLENAQIPEGLREKIDLKLKRLRRMARQGQSAGEYESVAKYIDLCLSIPWGRHYQDNMDLHNARAVMDSMHYGSLDVKDVVMEYLAVLRRKTELQDYSYSSPVLAFVGVQGAGKTSLAKAIAASLGRPFYRMPLGALGSSSALRGTPSSSIDGQPGQIINAIVSTGCMNPIILLDEFDKVSGNDSTRKDFMAIMLEILDPGQNSSFNDHYVDFPVDLSKIMFIATANRFRTISRELLDRLEFIEFPDYTPDEKTRIAKSFLFPKVLTYAGLQPHELIITDDVWPKLIDSYGSDQGVRRLEQNLKKVARVVVKDIVLGKTTSVTISSQNVDEYIKYKLPNIEDIRDKDYTETVEKKSFELYPSNKKSTEAESSQDDTSDSSTHKKRRPRRRNRSNNRVSQPQPSTVNQLPGQVQSQNQHIPPEVEAQQQATASSSLQTQQVSTPQSFGEAQQFNQSNIQQSPMASPTVVQDTNPLPAQTMQAPIQSQQEVQYTQSQQEVQYTQSQQETQQPVSNSQTTYPAQPIQPSI
jgi:ATP-dependent Lon protease